MRAAAMSITVALRQSVEDRIHRIIAENGPEFEEDVKKVSTREENPAAVAARWLDRLELK